MSVSDFRHAFLHRTIKLLGEDAVASLRNKRVAIAGCGGVGGAVAITLARAGVGKFTLADPGIFDPPDINRQWAATTISLGKNKAEVYRDLLLSINPAIEITCLPEGITNSNPETFMEDADILIDCLDLAVPGDLRARVFRAARARGIYCISSPVLGFGTVTLIASPDGIPMEAILGGMVQDASESSSLPPGLKKFFVPELLERTAAMLHEHRVPSISISVTLATAICSAESLVLLLGTSFPGWRPPACLPYVHVSEPLTNTSKIVHIGELTSAPEDQQRTAHDASSTDTKDVKPERKQNISQAANNLMLINPAVVSIDFHSDSWSEISGSPDTALPSAPPGVQVETILHSLYGYRYNLPVFRGRYAEGLLAKVLLPKGGVVITNALFPTTRFHLESNGAQLHELQIPEAYDSSSDHPFKGNLDLNAVKQKLEEGTVRAVYVELCDNATGGHPVSLAHLRALRELTATHRVPLVLDACRAFENALLLREREEGLAGKTLTEIVIALCACSDAAAISLTKDFPCRKGAFIGVNHESMFVHLRDLVKLANGDGLSSADREHLAASLSVSPESAAGASGRTERSKKMWGQLKSAGVPVVHPAGGHGVFIDVGAMLPHIPANQFPAEALANALYLECGMRCAPGMGTPEQLRRGVSLLRLAVPVDQYRQTSFDGIVHACTAIMENRDSISGLERVDAEPGLLGQYLARYRVLS